MSDGVSAVPHASETDYVCDYEYETDFFCKKIYCIYTVFCTEDHKRVKFVVAVSALLF